MPWPPCSGAARTKSAASRPTRAAATEWGSCEIRRAQLIEPCARAPDPLAPLGGVRPDQLGELLGRAARRLVADHGEAVREGLGLDRLVDAGVELVDDRPRHAGGRDDAT